jgi:hypothetical protein
MSEPEFVMLSESVDEVPAALGTPLKRAGRRRALESVLVPLDAHPRRPRRLVMAALLLVGAAGIAVAVVAFRRRRAAQAQDDDSPGPTEEPVEDLELLAHAATDI